MSTLEDIHQDLCYIHETLELMRTNQAESFIVTHELLETLALKGAVIIEQLKILNEKGCVELTAQPQEFTWPREKIGDFEGPAQGTFTFAKPLVLWKEKEGAD